jgi:AAA family ATP:ADP antiporter
MRPAPEWLRGTVDIRDGETAAALWSAAYFFFVLSSYYVIRPIRDEMGVAGGVDNLKWLFAATLGGMLLANPIFSSLVARLPVRRFIPITYAFFIANLLIFFAVLSFGPGGDHVWIGRVFFIWTSIFNLFVVSVFWAMMVHTFRTDQGKRLFGFIGVGGTLGGILGASLTTFLAPYLGPVNLLIVSAALLAISIVCMLQLARRTTALSGTADAGARPHVAPDPERAIGGGVLAGITHATSSPYLLGICLYMLLYSATSTFLYVEQADIASRTFADRGARTAFFASIDLWVNVLTLVMQLFLTGRILRLIGVGLTLALLPAASILGFGLLGAFPLIAVFVAVQVARRAGNYALARPSREVLFTVIPSEDRFKAKNFIDTVVYRTGDQVGVWTSTMLTTIGLSVASTAYAAVPISIVWLLVSLWLGKQQDSRAKG